MAQRTSDDTMRYVRKDREQLSELRQKNWGWVRGLGGNDPLRVEWKMDGPDGKAARHDLVKLTIDGKTSVVAKQELEHYLRMS